MTDDSGHGPKSVTFNRKSRSRSTGTAGHVQPESAVRLPRNTHLPPPPQSKNSRDSFRRTATSGACLSSTLASASRHSLLFARQAAREDISVAKAMFAMIPSVATGIASLTLPRVRTIAVGNTHRLRVRWDSHPEFWGDLLVACRGRDERAMAALRRQGKLLFCGERRS
jgi:hypothetical protein